MLSCSRIFHVCTILSVHMVISQATVEGIGGGMRPGRTPLMAAALSRSNEAVDVLLRAEADTNIVDSVGGTVVLFAMQSTDLAIINKLCGVITNTEDRKEVFELIARKRIAMSGPVVKYVSASVQNTGIVWSKVFWVTNFWDKKFGGPKFWGYL